MHSYIKYSLWILNVDFG
jgi:hypothetical protein